MFREVKFAARSLSLILHNSNEKPAPLGSTRRAEQTKDDIASKPLDLIVLLICCTEDGMDLWIFMRAEMKKREFSFFGDSLSLDEMRQKHLQRAETTREINSIFHISHSEKKNEEHQQQQQQHYIDDCRWGLDLII